VSPLIELLRSAADLSRHSNGFRCILYCMHWLRME
jgi:hypothetical protein